MIFRHANCQQFRNVRTGGSQGPHGQMASRLRCGSPRETRGSRGKCVYVGTFKKKRGLNMKQLTLNPYMLF